MACALIGLMLSMVTGAIAVLVTVAVGDVGGIVTLGEASAEVCVGSAVTVVGVAEAGKDVGEPGTGV